MSKTKKITKAEFGKFGDYIESIEDIGGGQGGQKVITLANVPLTMFPMHALALMGFVRYESITNDYCILENLDTKQQCLFERNTGKQISKWWKKIDFGILEKLEVDYYIVQREDGKWNFFHIDNPEKHLCWWCDSFVDAQENLCAQESLDIDDDWDYFKLL